MFVYIFVVAATLVVGNGQFLNCNWVSSLNCGRYGVTVECGTDGNNYDNRCIFAKAQCKNKNLHIYADGTCANANYFPNGGASVAATAATAATTATPIVTDANTDATAKVATMAPTGPTTTRGPVFLGHNAVLDFFCLELSHEDCPKDTEQVCGTDMNTYDNFCEYDKQRCSHRKLQVAHFGAC